MTRINGRLNRVERALFPVPEDARARRLRVRLESARVRCGIQSKPSAELAALRDKSPIEILHAARRAVGLSHRGLRGLTRLEIHA